MPSVSPAGRRELEATSAILDLTGKVALVGFTGVTFTGDVTIKVDESSSAQGGARARARARRRTFVGSALDFAVSGVKLSGGFSIATERATGLTITLGTKDDTGTPATDSDDVVLDLGDAPTGDPAVPGTITQGTVTVSSAGVVAVIDGRRCDRRPGVSIGSTAGERSWPLRLNDRPRHPDRQHHRR